MPFDTAAILSNFFNYMRSCQLAHATSIAYAQDIRQFLTFVTLNNINLAQLTESHAHYFIQECQQKFSPASVQRKIGSLKLFWRFRGRIPTTTMSGSFSRPEQKVLSDEKLFLLFAACAQEDNSPLVQLRNIALLILLLRVKVPATQLAQLSKEQVVIRNTTLTITIATGQKITAILSTKLLEKLQVYKKLIDTNIYFFQTASNTPMTPQAIRALPAKLARTIKTKSSPISSEATSYVPDAITRQMYDQLHPRG